MIFSSQEICPVHKERRIVAGPPRLADPHRGEAGSILSLSLSDFPIATPTTAGSGSILLSLARVSRKMGVLLISAGDY
jgi:hypothetical protein